MKCFFALHALAAFFVCMAIGVQVLDQRSRDKNESVEISLKGSEGLELSSSNHHIQLFVGIDPFMEPWSVCYSYDNAYDGNHSPSGFRASHDWWGWFVQLPHRFLMLTCLGLAMMCYMSLWFLGDLRRIPEMATEK